MRVIARAWSLGQHGSAVRTAARARHVRPVPRSKDRGSLLRVDRPLLHDERAGRDGTPMTCSPFQMIQVDRMPRMSTSSPLSKYPTIPARIRRAFERPSAEVVANLRRFSVGDLCDIVGNMYTMRGVGSIYAPGTPMCGVAMTVKCPPGDNLGVIRALTMVQRGDVVVIDAQGFVDYCLGGFRTLEYAVGRGALGFVVHGDDGSIRP